MFSLKQIKIPGANITAQILWWLKEYKERNKLHENSVHQGPKHTTKAKNLKGAYADLLFFFLVS